MSNIFQDEINAEEAIAEARRREVAAATAADEDRANRSTPSSPTPSSFSSSSSPVSTAAPSSSGSGLSEGFDWSALEGIDWSQVNTVDQWKDVVRERFPAFSWAIDHPDLGPILEEAAEGEYTEATFDANLRATEWWISRTETQRAWDIFEGDPSNATEVERRIAEATGVLSDQASQLGATLTDVQLEALARGRLRNGLSDDEVVGEILQTQDPSTYGAGLFTSTEGDIRATAADFMVTLDDDTIRSMATKVVSGEMVRAGVIDFMKNLASNQYPSLVGLIEGGTNLREYTAPHRKLVADMLGRVPGDIDLMGEFRDVLSIGDKNGPRPMTLSETERFVRSKDEYWEGTQGQGEMFTLADGLSKALGVRR